MESPNTVALSNLWRHLGVGGPALAAAFRTFNAAAEPFRAAADQAAEEGEAARHDPRQQA